MTPRGFTVTVNRYAAIIKWVSIVLIVVSILLIFRQLPIGPAIQRMENRIGDLGIWEPVVFGLLYVVAVVLLALETGSNSKLKWLPYDWVLNTKENAR